MTPASAVMVAVCDGGTWSGLDHPPLGHEHLKPVEHAAGLAAAERHHARPAPPDGCDLDRVLLNPRVPGDDESIERGDLRDPEPALDRRTRNRARRAQTPEHDSAWVAGVGGVGAQARDL